MKERPILFSGPMVRAIIEGRKTQTRRVFSPEMIKIEPHPKCGFYYTTFAKRNHEVVNTGQGPFVPDDWLDYSPYGHPGDRLWVRETWYNDCPDEKDLQHVYYRADAPNGTCCEVIPECQHDNGPAKWRPSIHMPRWASRITLEIVKVRVERVRDIGEQDSLREGVAYTPAVRSARRNFEELWDSLNASRGYGWDKNPWVWVIEFRRLAQEILPLESA